jgi:acetyl-CoA carboxylase biotin carboxyl carrier protein
VRAPLPGTFYRAPKPGAPPFVEVGSRVGEDTVVGIVETMKLMNSVCAGVRGTVTEICLADGQVTSAGTALLHIDPEAA